jgi:uncharacterized protein (DUF4415 family)
VYIVVIYTRRNRAIRIISARAAENEKERFTMNEVVARQARNRRRRSKLTAEQIETLEEARLSDKQIAALPNVLQLTSSQIDLAVEIGAIPNMEGEVPLNKMVQKPDNEIDFSDIPRFDPDAWADAVVITAKKTKRLVSIRLDPDIADFFQMQGKGYSAKINAVLRAYVEAKKTDR